MIKNILVVALISLFATSVFAQGDIISAADFTKLVKSNAKNIVIVDASAADSYKKSHVRNAVNIPSASINIEGGDVEGLLLSPDKLAELFGKAGVDPSKTIIVYDGGTQKYSSRVYWALKYIGIPDVKILHKNMNMWKKSRVPLTPMPSKVKAATVAPSVNAAIIADLAYVKSGKATIVDVRTTEEYGGIADNSDGHIPGAIHLNFEDLLTETGAFKSKEDMEKVMSAHGLTASSPIVAYCRTSVRATVLYAALVNVLGYNDVKVYDGAYLEWINAGNKLEAKAGVSTTKKASSGGGC